MQPRPHRLAALVDAIGRDHPPGTRAPRGWGSLTCTPPEILVSPIPWIWGGLVWRNFLALGMASVCVGRVSDVGC